MAATEDQSSCPTGILIDFSDTNRQEEELVPIRFSQPLFGSNDSIAKMSPIQRGHNHSAISDEISPVLSVPACGEEGPKHSPLRRQVPKFNYSGLSDSDLLENVTLDLDHSSDTSESKCELIFVDSDQEPEHSKRSIRQDNLSIQEIVEVFKEATSVAIQLRNYGRDVYSCTSPILSTPFKSIKKMDISSTDKENGPKTEERFNLRNCDLATEANERLPPPLKLALYPLSTNDLSKMTLSQDTCCNGKAAEPGSLNSTNLSGSPVTDGEKDNGPLETLSSCGDPKSSKEFAVDDCDPTNGRVETLPLPLLPACEPAGDDEPSKDSLSRVHFSDKKDTLPRVRFSNEATGDSTPLETDYLPATDDKENESNVDRLSRQDHRPAADVNSTALHANGKPKLPSHLAVTGELTTTTLTQVLHANRKKAVSEKSPKVRRAPMKAMVFNPGNGPKSAVAVVKTRIHSDGSQSPASIKAVSSVRNVKRTSPIKDSISAISNKGVLKVVQTSGKVTPSTLSSKPSQIADHVPTTEKQKRRSGAFTPSVQAKQPSEGAGRGMSPRRSLVSGTVSKPSISRAPSMSRGRGMSPARSIDSGTFTQSSVASASKGRGVSPGRTLVSGPAVPFPAGQNQEGPTPPRVQPVCRKSFGTATPPPISPTPAKTSTARRRSGIPSLNFVTPPKVANSVSVGSAVRRSSSFGGQVKRPTAIGTATVTRRPSFERRAQV